MIIKRILPFLLLAVVLVSCSKEEDVFDGYKVTDTVGIDSETVRISDLPDGITCITGLKNKKIWIGLYDAASKKEIQSWIGNAPCEEDIHFIIPYTVLRFNRGYAVLVGLDADAIGRAVLILRKATKELITCDDEFYSGISPFSDNIIAESTNGSVIISQDGERLFNSVFSRSIENTVLYYGFNPADHYWFALCDENNKILKEWNGTDKVERNMKLHVGNGEYVDYHITNILSEDFYRPDILETAWGYVIQPVYESYYYELLLLNDDRVYRVAEDEDVEMCNWYNGSFITRTSKRRPTGEVLYTLYSPKGDIILMEEADNASLERPFNGENITPVSYESYLHRYSGSSITLCRYNLNSPESKPLWECVIKNDLPDRTKVDWILLENESNNWSYQVDVIEYSGSKERIVFTVNIDTGELKYH